MKRSFGLLACAGALIVTLVGFVGSSPAGAATSIAARAQVNEIDVGVRTAIVGNVNPRRSGERVVLERRFSTSWSYRGEAVTDASGNYSISIRPTGTGIYAFRVRSGSVASATFYLRVWKQTYLDTFRCVVSNECLDSASISMNGKSYSRALYELSIGGTSTWAYAEYDLSRDFKKFNSVIGLLDNADSRSQVSYAVLVDGRQVTSGTVKLGVTKNIAIDVPNALRLRIQWRYVSGASYAADIGLGNPVLRS